jgi:hypothetical protein
MVVGASTVVAGSFNYTEPANLFNDENLLVCGAPYPESEGVAVDHAECDGSPPTSAGRSTASSPTASPGGAAADRRVAGSGLRVLRVTSRSSE